MICIEKGCNEKAEPLSLYCAMHSGKKWSGDDKRLTALENQSTESSGKNEPVQKKVKRIE